MSGLNGGVWEDSHFPVQSHLAAPFIRRPIFACTPVVSVESCLPGAIVRVFDDPTDQLLGNGVCSNEGKVIVNVGVLGVGDSIYATQEANSYTTGHSQTVTVEDYGQNAMPTPRLKDESMWECGEIAPTEGTLPGMRVELFKNGVKVAGDWTTSAWGRNGYWPLPHSSTPQGSDGASMKVRQVYCPKNSDRNASNLSAGQPVQPEPNPMPSLGSVYGFEGTRAVKTKGSTFGAQLDIFANGASSPFDAHPAPWPNMRHWYDQVITSSDSFSATQELCPGNVSTPVTGGVYPPAKAEQRLDALEIVEPVCPNSEAIRVRTRLSTGRIAIIKNTNFLFQGPAGNGLTTLGIPPSATFTQGDTVQALQFLEGGQLGNQDQATVGGNPSFKVLGEKRWISQNKNVFVRGFVREESRGPRFVLQECCGQKSPPSVEVKIGRADTGQSYPELVTLRRQSNGYYTGRWDWFVPGVQAPDGVWPPAANHKYTATVTLPCSGDVKTQDFSVWTGEADENDPTAPSEVTLNVAGADGNSETVSMAEGMSKSVEVTSGETSEVTAKGLDIQGLQEISVKPTTQIDSPTSKTAVESVPIPPKLSLHTDADALEPYESTTIHAEATNFAQTMSTTPLLKLVGRHDQPEITSIDPDAVYSNDTPTIDIHGHHLLASTTVTTVHFEMAGSIQADSPANGGDSDELEDIAIPTAIQGHMGTVSVTVETSHAATNDSKTSDPATFELLDRAGSFQSFDGLDFDSTNKTCSSSEPGTISDVTITLNPSSCEPGERLAVITYDGTETEDICYNVLATGAGNPDLGGVVLFDSSCRTLAMLSYKSGTSSPPEFFLTWKYFGPDGGEPSREPQDHLTLSYLDDNDVLQTNPEYFRVLANADGSVAINSNPVAQSGGPSGIPIAATITDMLDPDNTSASTSSYGYCPDDPTASPGTSCMLGPNISGQDASLELNSSEIVDLTLSVP